MSAITATFRPATLRLLQIHYHCDLTRSASEVIPLGVLSELSTDDVYGLRLTARRELSGDEVAKIGDLVRKDFATPFLFLRHLLNEVLASSESRKAFDELVDRHTHSLRLRPLPNRAITLPRPLATANVEARSAWVRDELAGTGNAAYWDMFPDHVPGEFRKTEKAEIKIAA